MVLHPTSRSFRRWSGFRAFSEGEHDAFCDKLVTLGPRQRGMRGEAPVDRVSARRLLARQRARGVTHGHFTTGVSFPSLLIAPEKFAMIQCRGALVGPTLRSKHAAYVTDTTYLAHQPAPAGVVLRLLFVAFPATGVLVGGGISSSRKARWAQR